MTTVVESAAGLHQDVQQFYARQMFLLDSGQVDAWAETFTEDGVFAANAHPEPAAGRDVIASVARQAVENYVAAGIQRRHWLGMVAVEPRGEDEAYVRSYALVIETPRGGAAGIKASTLCEDTIVRDGLGSWLVKHRQVTRDDLI